MGFVLFDLNLQLIADEVTQSPSESRSCVVLVGQGLVVIASVEAAQRVEPSSQGSKDSAAIKSSGLTTFSPIRLLRSEHKIATVLEPPVGLLGNGASRSRHGLHRPTASAGAKSQNGLQLDSIQ